MLAGSHVKNRSRPKIEDRGGGQSISPKPHKDKYRTVRDNLRASLAPMVKIERRLDALSSPSAKETMLWVVGNWLVREEILYKWIKHRIAHPTGEGLTDLPGLKSGNFFTTLRHLLLARRVKVSTSASAICIRGNVRAFYINPRPLTLWVGLPPLQPKLSATIEIRNRFVVTPRVRVPRVISQEASADPPYILEESITGRRFGQPQDWAALTDMLLKPLFQFYDQGRIRHRRATEVYDRRWIISSIANLLPKLRWKKTWLSREQLIKTAEKCLDLNDETLPLCLGHGDLGKSNLLVTVDGAIALLDWERSRELPIAADLLKLICRYHPLARRLEPELLQRTEDSQSMPQNRQLLLATLNRIAFLSNVSQDYLNKRATHRLTARKTKLLFTLASFLIREQ